MEIRCSGLARPMVCAGYVFLKLPKSPSNPAAEEGTAAGEYLERVLLNKVIPEVSSNNVYYDEDMKFHGNIIAKDIFSRASDKVMCEQRIDWQTSSGIWIRGQYDIAFVDHQGRLCIEDLKYGWGIIEVKENWQLLGYAIGEVMRRGQAFKEISLKIHQPRPHHEDGDTREWVLTYEELLSYKDKIEKRMMEISQGEKTLQTSSKCRYCAGAAEACPAFNRLFYRALEVSTDFHQDSLTEDEISRQLDQIYRANEVIKIKLDSITQLATDRIKNGKIIPNYVQVTKYGNRNWKKGFSPEAIKVMTGKDLTKKSVMSPAQAEKLGMSKELVSSLTEQFFKGQKLEKRSSSELGNKIFGTQKP